MIYKNVHLLLFMVQEIYPLEDEIYPGANLSHIKNHCSRRTPAELETRNRQDILQLWLLGRSAECILHLDFKSECW